MQQTMTGIAMWSVWQPDRSVFFNSFFVPSDDGNLLIDPLPLSDADAADIKGRGGVAWIVVTNRDHERATADAARRFGAKVASGPDAGELRVSADRVLSDGDTIGDARVLTFEGLKTPGEIALWFPKRDRTVVVGDALWGDPAGALRIMPKVADPVRAALSLRALLALVPTHLLVGDGAPIFGKAYDVLNACLDGRDDVHVNVVNIDDLPFESDRLGDPPGFRSEFAEVGFLIGATKLGYRAVRIPPGESFCPLHWHTAEEELFIVWDGEPTLRTPRGTTRLRRGDLVAFQTNARGAHRVSNEGSQPCTIVMIANNDRQDVCYYPDSDKLLVDATGTMVRASPTLDYYDREA